MRILVAIEDPRSLEALTNAVVARFPSKDTEVKILSVVDPVMPILVQANISLGWELVKRAEALLRKAGYKTETAVDEGDPTSWIIDEAKEWNADLILVGSHGHKRLKHFLLAGVSEAVARHAGCSVEIVQVPSSR